MSVVNSLNNNMLIDLYSFKKRKFADTQPNIPNKRLKFEHDESGDESCGDDSEDFGRTIKWVHWQEFKKELLKPMSREPSYPKRFALAQKYCKPKTKDFADLYVTYDQEKDLHLKIEFVVKEFESLILKEEYFREPNLPLNQKHHFINIYECYTDKQEELLGLIAKIRISVLGSRSELEWVQKGVHFSGNQIIECVIRLAKKMLRGVEMELYDDSHFPVAMTRATKKRASEIYQVPFWKFRALSTENKQGLTWYEEKGGFLPAQLENYDTIKDSFHQNPKEFRKAIKTVRETRLSTVLKTHGFSKTVANTIKRLEKRYFKQGENPTIHSLLKKMNLISPASQRDMGTFFQQVIEIWNVPLEGRNNRELNFLKSLEILEGIRIFRRVF